MVITICLKQHKILIVLIRLIKINLIKKVTRVSRNLLSFKILKNTRIKHFHQYAILTHFKYISMTKEHFHKKKSLSLSISLCGLFTFCPINWANLCAYWNRNKIKEYNENYYRPVDNMDRNSKQLLD